MKKLVLISLLLLTVGLTIGCSKEIPIENKESVEIMKQNKENIPTIFLHGYKGSNQTMKTMMNQLEIEGISKEEMVISISSTGELFVKSAPEKGFQKNNPTIRLIFEDNTSHQWNQAEWLKTALTYLKSEYQVEEVNLVGFSMGGISSFLYLETFSTDETQPKVNKLVTIGAPFNEFIENGEQTTESILQNGPETISEQLDNYRSLSDNIPKDTKFLLIAGELSDTDRSDGTVPLSSGLGVYSLLKEKDNDVQYKVILGSEGQHSQLKLNEEVSSEVLSFLWE